MADNKQLKFQFIVDEATLQKTRQLIRELTSDLAKLGEAVKGALGGISGSGTGGPGINITGGGIRSPEQQKVVAKTAPIGRQLVQNFLDQKQIFKGIADGSKDSMRVMNESLRSAIDFQKRELERLDSQAKKLVGTYDELGGAVKNLKASGKYSNTASLLAGEQAGVGLQHQQVVVAQSKATAELKALEAMKGGGGGGGGGIMAGLTGPNSFMGGMMNRMGISPRMIGGAGLAAVGAWGLKNIANQLWNGPTQVSEGDAAWGKLYGKTGMDIYGGEMRNITARNAILNDSGKLKDYNDLDSGWRRFVYGGKAFLGGDFNGALSGRAGEIGVRERQNRMVQAERESDPLADAIMGEYQNYNATVGSLRAMRAGPRQGESGLNALKRIRASYAGFDDSAIAGARQALLSNGVGGWGMVGGILQGEAAGIAGLGQSTGMMGRYGNAAAFLDSARRFVGGGADASSVSAASQFVAGQYGNLGMSLGGSGEGLMNMALAGGGGRAGVDQNLRGLSYLQRSVNGQTSPYQAARNVMIAMQSAPGLNVYGSSYLANKMNMAELAEAANGGGGDVNAVFKALGGNKAQAASYLKGHMASLTEGVSGAALAGTDAGKMMALLQHGGDAKSLIRNYKKSGFNSQEQALAAYAGVLQASDTNMSAAEAMGIARSSAGMKAGKGRAAGDVAGGSPELAMARESLKALELQAQATAGKINELTAAAKNLQLRAQLEIDGVINKNTTLERRNRIDSILNSHPEIKTTAEVNKILSEMDAADAAREKAEAERAARSLNREPKY